MGVGRVMGEEIWVQIQWMTWIGLRFGWHPEGWFHDSFSGKKDTSPWNAQGKQWNSATPSKGTKEGHSGSGHSISVMLSSPQQLSAHFLQTSTTLVELWRPNRSMCLTQQAEGTSEIMQCSSFHLHARQLRLKERKWIKQTPKCIFTDLNF